MTCRWDFTSLLIAFLWIVAAGCAPPFSEFQSAAVLPPGRFGITPSVSAVDFRNEGEPERSQMQYGAQLAFGVAERTEIRAGYIRIEPENFDGVNVVGFAPKTQIIRERLALSLPVGFAFGDDIDVADSWQFHPTLIFTQHVVAAVELNPSAKLLLPLSGSGEAMLAFNLGLGFSGDFSRWAVRPEVGFLFDPGEDGTFLGYGLGFTINP